MYKCMNKFYIIDTTQRNEPFIFENVQGLITHLAVSYTHLTLPTICSV